MIHILLITNSQVIGRVPALQGSGGVAIADLQAEVRASKHRIREQGAALDSVQREVADMRGRLEEVYKILLDGRATNAHLTFTNNMVRSAKHIFPVCFCQDTAYTPNVKLLHE